LSATTHVGQVVVEDLERISDLAVEIVVLAVRAALIGVRVVAAVAELEEARLDAGDARAHAVDDLGDLAAVIRRAAVDGVVLLAEARAVVLVESVEAGIALRALESRIAGVADELLGRVAPGARRVVERAEGECLPRLVRAEVVPRETEILEAAQREDARGALPESGSIESERHTAGIWLPP
jgi:hypothetical protein